MKNINWRRILFGAGMAGMAFLSTPHAATALSATAKLRTAFESIYCSLLSLLPPIGMVVVVLAAVIYAAGQIGGAEFRASATKWATALIVGAVLSLVIILLIPSILGAIDSANAEQYVINCS